MEHLTPSPCASRQGSVMCQFEEEEAPRPGSSSQEDSQGRQPDINADNLPPIFQHLTNFYLASKNKGKVMCKICLKEIRYSTKSNYNIKCHYQKMHHYKLPSLVAAVSGGSKRGRCVPDDWSRRRTTATMTNEEKSNEWADENEKIEQVPSSVSQTLQSSSQINRKRAVSERESLLDESVRIPEELPCKAMKESNDDSEYKAFGAFVAESLKNLPIENAISAQTNIVRVLTDEKRKAFAARIQD